MKPITPAPTMRSDSLDDAVLATLARLTAGLSPSSMIQAMTAWWTSLASSPAEQSRCMAVTFQLMLDHWGGRDREPTDTRFSDRRWHGWPWLTMARTHETATQWWEQVTRIDGMPDHAREQMSFYARQWLDLLAPSNLLATNPHALGKAMETLGGSLHQGWLLALEDLREAATADPTPKDMALTPGAKLATTPGQVVLRNHLVELIQYAPTTSKVQAAPIFIVPSCIMKYYILDLSPHNSMVRWLVDQGHTVFMVSWRNPDAADAHLTFDDYVRQGVLEPLALIHALCRQPVHLVGYCLGGTFAAVAAAALAREHPPQPVTPLAGLTLMAAETDFSEPGEMGVLIDEAQVKMLEAMMGSQGFLSGRQMAGSFQFLHARDLVWARRTQRWLLGEETAGNDLMAWNADVTRLPATMHSQYLRRMYLDNALANGRYRFEGRPVNLRDIRAPLFVVGTEKDHVSPWRSVFKIHQLADVPIRFVLTNGGHNAGIVSEPGHAHRHYRWGDTASDGARPTPEQWLQQATACEGSWWLAWSDWLTQRATGPEVAPRHPDSSAGLGAAPGHYVHVRYAD